ncbi:hypothetical protein FJK98_00120 [Micromonospora sp. HM134]|uniref:hypothetical protein n=1 Tax=Micromonospora sp. HM134 TaxID=2583243 RepID=UPI0011984162|nr:hypothetical protein [Micromonospora sp. HM134]QDY05759.1 hypothetical protein FJK98_00120 [Micromonospora sp. HM134]
MISESIYWRRDLFNLARELRRKSSQRNWQEASAVRLEKALLVGCYAVRRLLDSAKLSNSYREKTISAVELPALDVNLRRLHFAPPNDLEIIGEMYDFRAGRSIDLKLPVFINQFIHSYTLLYIVPCDEVPRTVILVTSDRDRLKRLLAFWLDDIAHLFEHAAISDQSEFRRTWNEAKKAYIFDGNLEPSTRLAEWGFASLDELNDAISRYDKTFNVGNLSAALATLRQAIESCPD